MHYSWKALSAVLSLGRTFACSATETRAHRLRSVQSYNYCQTANNQWGISDGLVKKDNKYLPIYVLHIQQNQV